MTSFSGTDLVRFTDKARAEGVSLKVNQANGLHFHATSSQAGQPGYSVMVKDHATMPNAAECTCPAGQKGICCKHAAAAITAVRARRVARAAQIMRAAQLARKEVAA